MAAGGHAQVDHVASAYVVAGAHSPSVSSDRAVCEEPLNVGPRQVDPPLRQVAVDAVTIVIDSKLGHELVNHVLVDGANLSYHALVASCSGLIR